MTEKANIFNLLFTNFKQNKTGLFRLWAVMAGVYLVSLMLGVAIFLIVFGVEIALRRIIIYWAPTRNWLVETFHLNLPEYDTSKTSPFYKMLVNIFHSLIALLFLAIGIYVARMGVDMLFRDGFLGQNFIYLMFFRLST